MLRRVGGRLHGIVAGDVVVVLVLRLSTLVAVTGAGDCATADVLREDFVDDIVGEIVGIRIVKVRVLGAPKQGSRSALAPIILADFCNITTRSRFRACE